MGGVDLCRPGFSAPKKRIREMENRDRLDPNMNSIVAGSSISLFKIRSSYETVSSQCRETSLFLLERACWRH